MNVTEILEIIGGKINRTQYPKNRKKRKCNVQKYLIIHELS